MNEVGRIISVDTSADDGVIYVDVSVSPNRTHDDIKFRTPGTNVWVVPEVGDVVEVADLGHNKKIAFAPHNSPGVSMPDMNEGDVAVRMNDATLFHIKERPDGKYDIVLHCDGEAHFLAEDIFIGDKQNVKKVATEDHTHDYSWTDAAGSGTTDGPSDTTDTEIE
jgi:hypothetical protein